MDDGLYRCLVFLTTLVRFCVIAGRCAGVALSFETIIGNKRNFFTHAYRFSALHHNETIPDAVEIVFVKTIITLVYSKSVAEKNLAVADYI